MFRWKRYISRSIDAPFFISQKDLQKDILLFWILMIPTWAQHLLNKQQRHEAVQIPMAFFRSNPGVSVQNYSLSCPPLRWPPATWPPRPLLSPLSNSPWTRQHLIELEMDLHKVWIFTNTEKTPILGPHFANQPFNFVPKKIFLGVLLRSHKKISDQKNDF